MTSRRRLLFLLPFPPRLDAPHGGRAAVSVIARLAERHDVALLYLRAPGEEPAGDDMLELCRHWEEITLPRRGATRRRMGLAAALARGVPMEAFASASATYRARLERMAVEWRPDVVQAELQRMSQYLPSVARNTNASRVLVAYEADAETASEVLENARGSERLFRALDLRAWRRYERRHLPAADAVVAFTDRDRTILEHGNSIRRTVTIPLRLPIPRLPLDAVGTSPPTVLFVGGFGHPPNVDAAIRLGAAVFPRVRARVPEARLQIVGDRPPASVRALADDSVTVTGRVPDVEPYVGGAAVVAAPLRLGGGMRVKVLEALGFGKAIVATSRALEGLRVTDGNQVVIADGDVEIAEAIVRLLLDPAERSRLGTNARAWAEQELDLRHSVADYEALYEELLAGRVT